MFSILSQQGCCSKAVTSKWPLWCLDTVIISDHVFLPLAFPSCHLGFISALCVYSDFLILARFTISCLCSAQQTTFLTIDALGKYLEYFCKPVTTCSTVGALKISIKVHVCFEALSQCLSFVYILPSFSSFQIIPVTSTNYSLSALNIHALFSLPRTLCVSSSFKFKPCIYDTQSVIIYTVCSVGCVLPTIMLWESLSARLRGILRLLS